MPCEISPQVSLLRWACWSLLYAVLVVACVMNQFHWLARMGLLLGVLGSAVGVWHNLKRPTLERLSWLRDSWLLDLGQGYQTSRLQAHWLSGPCVTLAFKGHKPMALWIDSMDREHWHLLRSRLAQEALR